MSDSIDGGLLLLGEERPDVDGDDAIHARSGNDEQAVRPRIRVGQGVVSGQRLSSLPSCFDREHIHVDPETEIAVDEEHDRRLRLAAG